jgi:hypothetical protein
MSTAEQLLADALHLDERERAALALELLNSLSGPGAHDEVGWIEEIERRARRALSGEAPGVDANEALDRIALDLAL